MDNKQCTQKPWVNLFTQDLYYGAEGENDNEDDPKGESDDDKSGQQGEPKGAPKDDEDNDSDDTKGLKSALAAERARAKAADKELKKLQKEKADKELADKSEVEQAQIKAKSAEEKAEKLASGLLRRDLDAAIRQAAKDFVDPTDAIDGVDRSLLVYDQDSDDPTDITIDEKSVLNAVKKLSTKKPHFLKTGTDDGNPTGSQLGGSRGKGRQDRDAVLKTKYPSLNH